MILTRRGKVVCDAHHEKSFFQSSWAATGDRVVIDRRPARLSSALLQDEPVALLFVSNSLI
jgi:hypothetical protein